MTQHSLQSLVPTIDRELIVVSNREPYIHVTPDEVQRPVGGLTAALDTTLQKTGGTWIAWGSGDADFTVTTDHVIDVPPESTRYRLHRLQLTDAAVEGYYLGYSNQVLWPLAHGLLDRVRVDPPFWDHYRAVNEQFATATSTAIDTHTEPLVWFQDYHLALAPKLLRDRIASPPPIQLFWHIPWPHPSFFARCPHASQLLRGLLGADRLGFQIERYQQAFLDTVRRLLADATVTGTTIEYQGRTIETYAAAIGVDITALTDAVRTETAGSFWSRFRDEQAIGQDETLITAVDRLDYTKGIPQRLAILEELLQRRPDLHGQVRLIQKGTPTRTAIPAYQRHYDRIRERITVLNDRFGTADWQPVTYIERRLPREQLLSLLHHGDIGFVTSLADGFNLTALEYAVVSSGPDELLLSRFCGAAHHLDGAVLINPHDIGGVADRLERLVDQALPQTNWERLTRQTEQLDITSWLAAGLDHR